MAEVINLLDSDDEVAVLPSVHAPARSTLSAPSQLVKALTRSAILDLSDDDFDFPDDILPDAVSFNSQVRPPSQPKPLPSAALRRASKQALPPEPILLEDDDYEIVVAGPSISRAPGGGLEAGRRAAETVVLDDEDGVEIVAVSSPARPRASKASRSTGPSTFLPSPPLDPGPKRSMSDFVAGYLAKKASSGPFLDPIMSRTNSQVALPVRSFLASDSEDDTDVGFSLPPEPTASGPSAKRKKYKLDSSSEDDNGGGGRGKAGMSKEKGKGKAVEKRVKGSVKGKEKSFDESTDDDWSQSTVVTVSKRRKKTADEVLFDAAAKARKKEDKAAEVAQRKVENGLFKEANKLRSRATALRELLIDLPKQESSSRSIIARIKPELMERIEECSVRHQEYDETISNLIRFKREVKAEYDEATRQFYTIPTRIQNESTAVLCLSAEDVATHIADRTWLGLPSKVRRAAKLPSKGQVVIIIHGLVKYYRLEKNAADREYDAKIRGQSSSRNGRRKPPPGTMLVNKEEMERALVQLQVVDKSFITRVEADKDMVEFIMSFAGDVAHRPYKLIEYSHLPFCPDNTVSKGITPIDTFSKMLGTVKGVTPAMTIAVTKEYGTFRSLMEEYDRLEFKGGTEEQANHLLKDLVAEHRVDGAPNQRYINKAKSAQIRRMLRGTNGRVLFN